MLKFQIISKLCVDLLIILYKFLLKYFWKLYIFELIALCKLALYTLADFPDIKKYIVSGA